MSFLKMRDEWGSKRMSERDSLYHYITNSQDKCLAACKANTKEQNSLDHHITNSQNKY